MRYAFIQDVPTPHNNVVLEALREQGAELELWYAKESGGQYNFKDDLANAVVPARFYDGKRPDAAFLRSCVLARETHLIIVGWMNINTRLLLVLLWLLRRPYNVWFDLPQDGAARNPLKALAREAFYFILKTSRARVFCVGKTAINYFRARGFAPERLANLPIFVQLDKTPEDYRKAMASVRSTYGVRDGDFFVTTGSRLIFDKGFDLFIRALASLPEDVKHRTKAVIVGRGPEHDALMAQLKDNQLDGRVTMVDWMDLNDYRELVAASDVFIHPARFDAYGGGTLNAMAVGVPVIGAYQAGSAPDRVEDGVSGFLYDCNDTARLATLMAKLASDPELARKMGKAARVTAEIWQPARAADIVRKNAI